MNTAPPPPLPGQIVLWPIDDIVPSPFQERKHFDPDKMKEMMDSIIEHGIIQPLTARRIAEGQPLELVCGERRLRGGKMAELVEVPVIIRELTDVQAENIVLIENIQREDLTPVEEARSYDRLLKLRNTDGALMHTRISVAKISGKKTNHIDDLLKLLVCPTELQEAVNEGSVSLGVARLVGMIPDAKMRPMAAQMVMKPSYQQVPLNFQQTKELIREEFTISLANAPWNLDDAGLVPEKYEEIEGVQVRCFGGACSSCPMMSGNMEAADVKKTEADKTGKGARRQAGGSANNLCTLPKCHRAKLDAVCKQQRRTALEKGLKVLDDDEAKKQFHPARHETANGAKYVWLDETLQYHQVGHLCYSCDRKWRQLIKDSDVTIVMGRNPHTGLLVEMALLKEAKPVAEKAARAKKPSPSAKAEKSPAELKAEEDAARKRSAELRQGKIDKITLTESLNEIRSTIERKGVNAALLAKLCEYSLKRSGSDGCRFLGKFLEIEPPKVHGSAASGWGVEKLIVKKMHEMCEDRVSAWNGMLALVIMSWELSFNELSAEAFKGIITVLGIKLPEIERRANALFEGEEKAKAKGKKPEAKTSASNSVDPKNVSVDKVAATTAAADKRSKSKEAGAVVGHLKPDKMTNEDIVKLIAMPGFKDGSITITDLIGPKPDVKKDKKAYQKWNSVRMKILRKAGKA